MRLAMQINYAGNIRETIEQVGVFESEGLDIAFVPEAYGFDAISILGFLAARTTRIELGPGIVPIYSRTPALIAQTAAGLDYVSNGRAVLGLGASGPQVIEGWHGLSYDRPLARTREIIDICRSVWRRERLTHDGIYQIPLPEESGSGLGKPLKLITKPLRERIPIYVAAIGPKNVELAAERAEGWLPIFFVPEYADAVWGDAIARGKQNRPEELGPFEIVAGGALAIGSRVRHLAEMTRPMVALYVGGMGARSKNFYARLMERYGFESEASQIQELYLSGRKDEAAALVPDELIDGLNLVGDRGFVAERLRAFHDAGVRVLSVEPIGPDPVGSFRQLRELVDRL
ncbi:MAG: LLM class F420-dependent oxidoreductase [Ferrimicrobium sp.]